MRAYADRSDDFAGRLVTDPPRPPVSPEHREDEAAVDALIESAFSEPTLEDEAVECLASRLTAGLGVQLLWAESGTYITLTLDGKTETFPVPAEHALDAFQHPFAYGGTLL